MLNSLREIEEPPLGTAESSDFLASAIRLIAERNVILATKQGEDKGKDVTFCSPLMGGRG